MVSTKDLLNYAYCVIALLFLGQLAYANDSSSALATGGIVLEQNDNIIMLSESLSLSPSKVRVEYEYLNNGSHDEDLLVAFALPRLDRLHQGMSYAKAEYLDFKTWVDGQEIKLIEGYKYWELDDKTQKLLTNLESNTEYYLVLRQQVFPKGRITSVVHEYTPAVGGGIPYYNYTQMRDALNKIKEDETNRMEHGYWLNCTDADDALKQVDAWIDYLKNMKGIDPSHDEYSSASLIWFNRLSYILKTGNNWNGPIRNFNLKVTADRPFFLNSCFAGLKRTSENSYEFSAVNYVPKSNISLMFHMR